MRVAIIGAGTSGMACAHELEKLGVQADIFEKKDKIGQLFPHVNVMMQLTHRPINDQIKYLKEQYDISITPLGKLEEIIMHAPTASTTIKGNDLGYLLLLGQDQTSVENQMATALQSTVHFNTSVQVKDLAANYDAVVVASGTRIIPQESGIWTSLLDTRVKGAVVIGDFTPGRIEMWVNTDYARNGYVYLIPFNSTSATLTLIVPNADTFQCDAYWHYFWEQENPQCKIVQGFELPYNAGFVFPHQIENIYFIGNAGGFLEPLLGFGLLQGIISGILAARSIVQGTNYEKEVQPLIEHVMNMTEFRKSINSFENKDYDKLIRILGMPIINKLIYNTNLDVIKYSSSLMSTVSNIALKKFPAKNKH